MPYCGENCLSRHENGDIIAVTLPCRAWTCDDCCPKRKRELIARCHHGTPNTFLTLTLRRVEGRTPDQAAKILTRAWRLLRLRIMRKRGWKKLPFAAVMEAHKSGYPHLHILMRSIWIDQAWLAETMKKIADSPVVDIRRIDRQGAINAYVAKYCGKAAHKFGTAKRFYFSRDYDLTPEDAKTKFKKKGHTWDRQQMPLQVFALHVKAWGYDVEFTATDQFRAKKRQDE